VMEEDVAPVGWAQTTIGNVYQVIGGGTPSTKNQDYWRGKIPWISSADINGVRDLNISRHITESAVENSATNKVPPQTLLVVTRVGLGKIAITQTDICFSQDLQGLIAPPDLISPEFALYYLSFALQTLKYEGRGTTISGITKKQLKDTSLPIPPINEQTRIVAKIEELFSELDKGIENLNTAREQLKVYRQAVLKHAFEGKLTEGWREENKDKLESSDELLGRIQMERQAEAKRTNKKSLKNARAFSTEDFGWLPELPNEWAWERLGYSTCGVEYGTSAKSAKTGKLPVLRMGNIQNAQFDWADLVFTSDAKEIHKYSLYPGDVLFNRTNSPELVGKTAIYKAEQPAIFAGYLIRVNQINEVDPISWTGLGQC